ncbi:GNAT family N-acetyltransferase [Streptomyces sp. NPDC003635]
METLKDILDAAAEGIFPPPDGRTTVVPQPSYRDAGVFAFTAHSVIATDEDEDWVYETLGGLDCDALAATMNPLFLAALMERTGRRADTIDVMTVGTPLPGRPVVELTEIDDPGHSRVVSSRRRRDDVRVWAALGGVLVLGRGVAGRLEAAVEVADAVRHRGLGRELARAARQLGEGEPVWAQVSAGNARSLRAFQAAGYRPVGSELLLSAGPRGADRSRGRS